MPAIKKARAAVRVEIEKMLDSESGCFHETVKAGIRMKTIRLSDCRIPIHRVFGIHEDDNRYS